MKDTTVKRNFIFALCFFTFCAGIFSMGIGPQADFIAGTDGSDVIAQAGISCSIKNDNIPLVISVATDYDFSADSFNVSVNGDYWLFNPMIGNYCSFYTGPGACIGGSFFAGKAFLCAAPRAVLGFSWIFYDGFLEYFVQAAAQPEWKLGAETEFALKIPCNAGIRLYF